MRMLFTFRVKVLLIYAASVLCLIFAVFAAGSYYVNYLQKRNKQDAITLAQEQARELAAEVIKIMPDPADPDLSRPEMRENLRSMMHFTLKLNKSVVLAGVFDEQGTQIVEKVNPSEQTFTLQPRGKDRSYSSQFRTPSGKPVDVEFNLHATHAGQMEREPDVLQPIRDVEGRSLGDIRLWIADSQTFQRISDTSRQITGALLLGCVLLFLFLLFVFWVLWRLFARQFDLLQRNERLDRMAYVGTLASGLAHEIRNPLSSMNVNLEVMREELAEAPSENAGRAAGLACRVQREVTQLASTLTSFLDFALPTKEGTTEFSILCLLEELLDLHSEQMRQNGITWELAVSPTEADTRIEADRRLIHQATRNILVNAIQIVGGSVKKHLRVRIDVLASGRCRISISDTGPGIAPENLDKIFEVFFSTRKGGSGFGLAIAKKIVEEHGGTIRAENNAEALGAVFIIELPKQAPAPRRLGLLKP